MHTNENLHSKKDEDCSALNQHESSECLQDDEPAVDYLNDGNALSHEEEKDYSVYSDSKSTELEELPKENAKVMPAKLKFQPKVPPTDYERFIYKCEHCMLGFKRRGKASST